MQNENRWTVLTGASSGIGRAAALAFAARGKSLILAGRNESSLKKLQREMDEQHSGIQTRVFPADLSRTDGPEELYEFARAFPLETWINCAGFGDYGSVLGMDLGKMKDMLQVNAVATILLSKLFVQDFHAVPGSQLLNVSSAGGYTIVPTAVAYCATKFLVSAFTEGLARELMETGAAMRAKVLAPAATKTQFGARANDVASYDYDAAFGTYHTSEQVADFLLALYDSNAICGIVDRETFAFSLSGSIFPYAGASSHNQKVRA